jgi:AcrR family transcriptional regulator
MTDRPRSRRGDGDQLRVDVLAAVNRLLDEWGSHEKLTMRAVAKEAGVAAPSIYLHFADKTELVWAALSDKYEHLAQRMRAADEAVDPADARGRLRAQVRAYCLFALANPGHYRLMYEVRQPSVSPARAGAHPARLVSRQLRAAISRCLDAGYALSLPPRQAGHTLWAGLHGIVALQHTLSATVAPDLVVGIAEGLLDALVATTPGPSPVRPPDNEIERLIAATVLDET